MKPTQARIQKATSLAFLGAALPGCVLVKDIFKAGAVVATIIIALALSVIVIVITLIRTLIGR